MNELIDKRWKEFEQIGEETLQKNIAAGYYADDKKAAALAWINSQERARESADRLAAAATLWRRQPRKVRPMR